MKYESASEHSPYLLQLWYTRGFENSMAETESRSMIVRNGQLIIPYYCSPAPRFRDYVSQTYEWTYHLVDNVLGPAGNVA